jgi:hypothetical protein
VRKQAAAHGDGYVEALKWMKEPERIENHINDMALSVEHPYWRGDKEERERVLSILDRQLELLRVIYPEIASLKRASGI